MKTKNYIYCETVGRYVTGTEGSNAHWETGKDAMAFSLTRAKDIFEGLTMNCWKVRIEIHPDFVKVRNGEGKSEKWRGKMSTEENSKTEIYMKICKRAEKLGYKGDFLSLMMDIESADKKFNLRLNDLLDADNFNFLHDIYGIVNNIVRDEHPAKSFGLFVPRFTGCSQPDFIAGKNEEETKVNQEGEVCQK